jgi:hypothetical protein
VIIAACAATLAGCGTAARSAGTHHADAAASAPAAPSAAGGSAPSRGTVVLPPSSVAAATHPKRTDAGGPASSATRPAGAGRSLAPAPPPKPAGADPSSSHAERASAPAPATPACELPALRIQALRGGASMGIEYALLMFTNDAATSCRVSGYPVVGLRHDGAPLGSARPAQTPGSGSVTLPTGGTAQVRVQVATDCAAPQSDHVRVGLPAADGFVALPLQLRGCALQVGAFQPAG